MRARSLRARGRARASRYPQLLYWFAMPFTAPVPWEAVAHYDGAGRPPVLRGAPGRRAGRSGSRATTSAAGSCSSAIRTGTARCIRSGARRARSIPREGEPGRRGEGPPAARRTSAGRCRSSIGSSSACEKEDDPELQQVPAGLLRRLGNHPGELRPRGAGRRALARDGRRAACRSRRASSPRSTTSASTWTIRSSVRPAASARASCARR